MTLDPVGMIDDMTQRRTISLPDDVMRDLEKYADGNVSGYIAEVLRDHFAREGWGAIYEAHVRKHGPIPQEISDDVDRQWRELFGDDA